MDLTHGTGTSIPMDFMHTLSQHLAIGFGGIGDIIHGDGAGIGLIIPGVIVPVIGAVGTVAVAGMAAATGTTGTEAAIGDITTIGVEVAGMAVVIT